MDRYPQPFSHVYCRWVIASELCVNYIFNLCFLFSHDSSYFFILFVSKQWTNLVIINDWTLYWNVLCCTMCCAASGPYEHVSLHSSLTSYIAINNCMQNLKKREKNSRRKPLLCQRKLSFLPKRGTTLQSPTLTQRFSFFSKTSKKY